MSALRKPMIEFTFKEIMSVSKPKPGLGLRCGDSCINQSLLRPENENRKIASSLTPSGFLPDKVGITMASISVLKNGKAKAIRLSTLEADL
jgi:hypothetical protein